MWTPSFRNSVYWLLFADVLIRFWIANGLPETYRIGGLFLHFLVGARIGILLLSRLRPANLVAAAPLLLYAVALVFSTADADRFSLAFQWLLTVVLAHTPIATDEANETATDADGMPVSPSTSETQHAPPDGNETSGPPAGTWRIVLGIVLICVTVALDIYFANFNTEGFNGMAVLFTHLFIYTPVLLSLSLPLLGSSRRGWPLSNRWLFGLFAVFFVLSWVILMARAYGVW